METRNQQLAKERGRSFVLGQQTVYYKKTATLTEMELRWTSDVVQQAQPGIFTWKTLFADRWDDVRSGKSFGRRAKRAVMDGLVPGLELREQLSNRSWSYEVLPRQVAANDELAQRTA